MIDRRRFITSSALLLATGFQPLFANTKTTPLYASSRRDKDGKNHAVIFSPDKGDVVSVALPDRAHQLAPSPVTRECVAIGRRPSRTCVVFGPDRKPHWFHARKDRHFQGHGVFSPEGRLFYTTENDYEGERGVIGVRDATNGYKQIGELSSHGIGAHEMAITDNGKTLVIANGGILTHPDAGRQKLNLEMMEPLLVYVDAKTGALIEEQSLSYELHQLSIRHFSIAPDGTVVLGMQQNGRKSDHPPLIGFHIRGKDIELVSAPGKMQRAMRSYVGSVAIDRSGKFACATCPRGNIVTFWNINKRQYLSHIKLADGGGAAPSERPNSFLLTSGLGKIAEYVVGKKTLNLEKTSPSTARLSTIMLHDLDKNS